MRRILGPYGGRRGQSVSSHPLKQFSTTMKSFVGGLFISVLVLLYCTFSLMRHIRENRLLADVQMNVDDLWTHRSSDGWRPSSIPGSEWKSSAPVKNGYLLVRCNGGLNQQRSAICNAVLAARIMNAILVLPDLDTNSFWHDKSGFPGIYDVDHFIKTLKNDIDIVTAPPDFRMVGNKKKKFKPFQLRPPRDASPEWYTTVALDKMKEHGAIYLTPFSHRLAEEINNKEFQRLRCRVNFHALRFKKEIMALSQKIVRRLRSEGHFMAIHLRFELDMLAFAGCLDIFTPEEQEILREYRKQNFAEKRLVYDERRMIGKCPLTPEEVGLILRSMGFDNTTRIYIAAGDIFGGERFMRPFRALFPRLENRTTIATAEELASVKAEGRGLLGPAVDYMVCLLADIFMPTYDGPSNFANNLMGHRLYYGFRTTIQPDRKALAPVFKEREQGRVQNFDGKIRMIMSHTPFGGPHRRVSPESFYTNPWPECFCKSSSDSVAERCPESVAHGGISGKEGNTSYY
ncbi:hypothetical protein KP509_16G027300 [Ceratopteris richardii]|uniref:O-fucosyltransferase family protein n=1 Tax=Ceratopteris richardii TaxID=49495 RepID=A0A8T2SXH4_CERRI|nr:hypothetical protein KP509_16G027300 [Ceratopteris richardii]